MKKVCTKCNAEKPLDLFSAHKKCRDGRQGTCKACTSAYSMAWFASNQERASKNNKRWRERNKLHLRLNNVRYKYGLSPEQYDALIKTRSSCDICYSVFTTDLIPHIDHCHATKKVRGVLCAACNRGLGQFRDNEGLLSNAVAYLDKHKRGEGI